MAAFYIFIFHGDFVQSVRLTYILPSHIEVKKFLGSDFGRVLEIGITWWSVAQLLMSLLTCVVALSHHSHTPDSNVQMLHFQKKPHLIFDCDVFSKHTHILHSDPLTHRTTKGQIMKRATISTVITSILWYRSPSMSAAWFWLLSTLCCAWYRPLRQSQRQVQL